MRLRQAVAAQQFTSGTETQLSLGREALEAVAGLVVGLVGGAMGLSGMAGAYIGSQLTGRASASALLVTMSGVLLVVGVLLMRDGVTTLTK